MFDWPYEHFPPDFQRHSYIFFLKSAIVSFFFVNLHYVFLSLRGMFGFLRFFTLFLYHYFAPIFNFYLWTVKQMFCLSPSAVN